jgi:hypothetical protein
LVLIRCWSFSLCWSRTLDQSTQRNREEPHGAGRISLYTPL